MKSSEKRKKEKAKRMGSMQSKQLSFITIANDLKGYFKFLLYCRFYNVCMHDFL